MLAGLGCSKSRLEVGTAGRRDGDDVQIRVGEKFVEVGVAFAAVGSDQLSDRILATSIEGVQFASGHGLDGLGVEVGDHASTDNSEFHVSRKWRGN